MSILENAIDSIIVGIEDYKMDDKRRLVSSTRNIYAGILLLFKYKLVELSPKDSDDVLIKQKLLPKLLPRQNESKKLEWIGKGKKTVDSVQIRERFEALNIVVDWKRLEKINTYRNNIEHYYSTESKESIKSLISNSFLIIRDFISHYLDKDPKRLLGEEIWEFFIEINEIYVSEKRDCVESLQKIEWTSNALYESIIEYKCKECGSDLIELNKKNEFMCKSCNFIYDEEILIEHALIDNISWRFEEEEALINCPDCGRYTYVISEKECQLCNLSINDTCIRCGCEIRNDELEESYLESSGLCSYCSYQANKND